MSEVDFVLVFLAKHMTVKTTHYSPRQLIVYFLSIFTRFFIEE